MFKKLTVAASLVLLASAGWADPVIYFGEDLDAGNTLPFGGNAEFAHNDFLSAISEVGTENMEGFSFGTTAPLSLAFVGSTGSISANLSGTFTRPPYDAVWNSPFDGRFAISGFQYWQTSDPFELVFSDPVSAFGFFATDGGDGPGQLTLRLGISGGGETYVIVPHTVSESADGAVMFFGFTDSTATYSSVSFLNSDPSHDFFGFDDWTVGSVAPPRIPVTIDIKPSSDPNCFNINGHGVIPVAVLSSETFDAASIDINTLSFGGLDVRVRGNKGPLCSLEDVSSDGLNDMVCHFQDSSDNWNAGEDEATLTGKLQDDTEIEGTDSICIVP